MCGNLLTERHRVFDEMDDHGEAVEDHTEPVKASAEIQSTGA
jgi:hypothetical protein